MVLPRGSDRRVEAPLIERPAFRKAARMQKNLPFVPACICIASIDRERAIIVMESVVVPFKNLQSRAERIVRTGKSRVQFDRSAPLRQRVVVSRELTESRARAVVSFSVPWPWARSSR